MDPAGPLTEEENDELLRESPSDKPPKKLTDRKDSQKREGGGKKAASSMADERLSPLFVCPQPRGPVLPGGHRALPQLQRSPLRRAQRPDALPGLPDRRGAEQLLHLDGEMPAAARWAGPGGDLQLRCDQTHCGGRMDL